MRSLTAFVVCAMLATVAQAQTPPASPAPTPPRPAAPAAPAATAPVAPAATPATPPTSAAPTLTARPITPSTTHQRLTLAERFEAANTTHDGHLTAAQAKAGRMNAVFRDFDQIDTAKKGYVTLDEIHAHNRARARARLRTPATPPPTNG